jgi:transcriptional regulator with PAS, ATPase and Fis domain
LPIMHRPGCQFNLLFKGHLQVEYLNLYHRLTHLYNKTFTLIIQYVKIINALRFLALSCSIRGAMRLTEKLFKIAIVYSVYPELTDIIRELVNIKKFDLEVRECVFDEAVKVALDFEKKGFDLIISRGVTGTLIKNAVSIPVVLVEITNFDILYNLHKAKQLGNKIAYFAYNSPSSYHDFETICSISGLTKEELTIYYFNNENELKEKIKKAFISDVDVVVASGAFVFDMAKQHGMKSIMVHSSPEAIYNAFRQGEEILYGRMDDRRIMKYFTSVSNYLKTGIVITDKDNKIIHVNEVAEKFLDFGSERYLGADISSVKSLEIYRSQDSKILDEIITINNDRYLLCCIPLMLDDVNFGMAFTLENIQQIQKTEAKIRKQQHKQGLFTKYDFTYIIGNSKEIKSTINKAKKYTQSDSTILITGESGTGKEIFAHSIHAYSYRAKGPFVAVNCATLPENLLESELFGYDEGAFTGAKKGGKPGLFELAHTGTIFLDEISEISMPIQARLLRVLQEKEIRRVGGSKVIPVDVRIIAATNADIQQKVKDNTFRKDLFYRLNVFGLNIPPLRNRAEDIPSLINYFLKKHAFREYTMPKSLIEKLKKYNWPGNIRELESFVEKYIVLKDDLEDIPLLDDLYNEIATFGSSGYKFDNIDEECSGENDKLNITMGTLEDMEMQIIKKMYHMLGKDKTNLARKLGISRTTVWSKLKK